MNELFLVTSICLSGMIAPEIPDPTVSYVYYILELDDQRKTYDVRGVPWRECLEPNGPTNAKIHLVDQLGSKSDEKAMIEVGLKAQPLTAAVRADLDGNGVVGFSDFSVLMQTWGQCNTNLQPADCP